MSSQKRHDLHDFMQQISAEMAAEYDRIRMRATEDPGTAGDQGEENWAELLREWLPPTYQVVTKGRIISEHGITGPQVDVLVLHGAYPKKLLNKKLYLAAGVAACFECKTTLKAAHVHDAVRRCIEVKSLYQQRVGTPYRELHTPVVYGLLAHSHVWKGPNAEPEQNVTCALHDADLAEVHHPRHTLDLICVADLGAWTSSVITALPTMGPDFATHRGHPYHAASAFVRRTRGAENQKESFTPVGVLISDLTWKLAWENPALQSLTYYYRIVNLGGSGKGEMRNWPMSVYSTLVREAVEAGKRGTGFLWDEWTGTFM